MKRVGLFSLSLAQKSKKHGKIIVSTVFFGFVNTHVC